MQRVSVLLIAAAMATPPAHGQDQSWQIDVVATAGTKPEVRLDTAGRPHVAYMIEAFDGGVFHGFKVDGQWAIETVSEGYFYAPLDMTIGPEDDIHIAYHDHDNEDIVYALNSGVDWALEIIAHPGHDGWDGRIALGPSGEVHIVSIDPSQFGSSSGIEWARRGFGNWQVEEIGSGRIPYEFGVALAVSDDGRLHVVYHDGGSGLNATSPGADLFYAVLSDGDWDIQQVDIEGDVGKFPSIVLDSAGLPHITYLDRTGERAGRIKYASHDGTRWNFDIVDELDDIEIAHIGARRTTAVALDERDNAYVAYSDKSVLRFAKQMENDWAIEDVTGPLESNQVLAQFVTLDVEGNGRPHLVFYEIDAAGSSSTGTVYYAVGPEVIEEPTAITEAGGIAPDAFELGQNYPNPFNPDTVIPYRLARSAEVEITVYDLAGQLVQVLTQGAHRSGYYETRWDGKDSAGSATASGLYTLRMRAGGREVQVQKMLLLR